MQAPEKSQSGRLLHQAYDRIAIPEDVSALGVKQGDEGVIRGLNLHKDRVFAFVEVTYSTGQTRGWVVMEIKPQTKIVSYTTAPR
jgi:radical SAM superfamily enzyme with C-terminal helix-hairpin-helix motif